MRSASTLPLSSKLLPALCGLLLISAAVQGLSSRPDLIEPLTCAVAGGLGISLLPLVWLSGVDHLRCSQTPEQRQQQLDARWAARERRFWSQRAPAAPVDPLEARMDAALHAARLEATRPLTDATTLGEILDGPARATLAPARPTDPGRH
jgi:hypothetical protein